MSENPLTGQVDDWNNESNSFKVKKSLLPMQQTKVSMATGH